MKGDKIPDENHVARYCKPMYVSVSDGEIQAAAFMVRPDEDSLSVNWLEFFKCSSRESEIAELRKAYSAKLNIKARADYKKWIPVTIIYPVVGHASKA
jgi:hypothetical protein